MEKFIPYEKLSKKKRRELDKARRGTWALNPVTRRPENPKAYNRKTARNWKDDSNSVPFCFAPGRLRGRDPVNPCGRHDDPSSSDKDLYIYRVKYKLYKYMA